MADTANSYLVEAEIQGNTIRIWVETSDPAGLTAHQLRQLATALEDHARGLETSQ